MGERAWRINIVDDSSDDRVAVKVALRDDPTRRYSFAEAETGRQGLHQLAASSEDGPDCLLLDFSLPDMNGAEFLSAMSRREGQVAVPVVVMTGFTTPETSRSVLKAGAQEFIGKDWLTSVSLARAVESAVERHGMARELWRHERELDRQREWLRVTLHGIGDGVVATDIMGRIMFMNPMAEQLMGYCVKEVAGRALGEVFRIVHEPTGQAVENPIARVLQEGQLVKLAEDAMLIRRDGLKRAIADSGAPIRDAAGSLIGGVLIFRDITQQKLSEQAARQREALLQAILQNTTALISAYDLEGRFVHVNRRFEDLFGKRAAEVCGHRPRDVFPAEQAAIWEANNQRVLVEGRVLEFEETIIQADGAHIYSSVMAPLQDTSCGAIGVVGVATDISEYKRVEAALREADQRKDEFLAMLAHELRNPLAPIRNAVHLLKHLGPPDPAHIRLHEMIARQVTHLSHLVDDLLDVNRIARGTIHLQMETVDLADILVSAVESCQPQLESRHHLLELIRTPGPLWVKGDPTRLSQIVLNLLQNSAKYTPDGGHIQVRLEATEDHAVIRVRDDGVGISAELLPHVFDLFVQAPQSLDRTEGGLGIGLSLVQRLTLMHRGSVEAFSEGPGKGSEFVVRLPLLKPSEVPAPAPPAVPAPPGRRLRILVVEDSPDVAESLRDLLLIFGYQAQIAHDGKSALAAAAAFRPDVVLLDIGLPDQDGYAVAGKLRQLPELAQTRLFALSGYGSAEDGKRAVDAGFDRHLVKPVEPDALKLLLNQIELERGAMNP